MREIAKQFWDRKDYPEYGTIKQRRIHEINLILPYLKGANSILDLGCGDGALVECLRHLTDAELYAYDFSEKLLSNIHPAIETKVYDCYDPKPLPETDVTIWGGVVPFIFEDEDVVNMVNVIDSPILLLRAPCAEEDTYVNTHSEALGQQYSSRYRTTMHIVSLLKDKYEVKDIIRVYPDDIESKFGTKQYYFICQKS